MARFFSIRSASRARFLAAAAVAASVVGYAPAQYIAPDVHGYAAQQIRNKYRAGQGTTRFQAPAVQSGQSAGPVYSSFAPSYQSAVVTPAAPVVAVAPATAYVGISGPDGVLRYYAVEGGSDALNQVIVVRPGQPATVRVVAPQAR